MADKPGDAQPTQKTQPRGIDPKTGKPYEPVEIPVPKRENFKAALKQAAKGRRP
jgi:hypothetical protein